MLDNPVQGSPGVHDIGALQPFVHDLPPEEQSGAIVLVFNLIQLDRLVNDFASAVGLLDHVEIEVPNIQSVKTVDPILFAKAQHMHKLWSEMAGRDAAMTIFHFGKTLESFGKRMLETPNISRDVDHAKLRVAKKLFHRAFSEYEFLRHGVGHRAESTVSVESVRRHSEGGMLIFGKIEDRTFTITFEGKHRTLMIDKATRRLLARTTNGIYAAFPKLAPNLPTSFEG